MSKNLSFKSLIIFLAVAATTVTVMAILSYQFLSGLLHPALAALIIALISWIAVYFIMYYLVDFYLYRRIKLVYKIIRSSKLSSSIPKKKKGDSFLLESVEAEASNWLEAKQQEIESLRELENYRKNFLGDISHELKTPIFAVQGYVHTLLDGGLEDPQVNRRFLQKAAQNIERLETIVEDLDVIAKLENATMELDSQNFDLKSLTNEVIEQVEVQAKKRKIKIKYKNDAERSFQVHADREYIRTVLINLLVNSIKYGNEGGRTKIGFYDFENYILIEVTDDGIGMEEKHLKHLFDRFYRVDKSRSRDRGGSGLGLSIVKHIIEAHKQTINVKSKLNKGTTFGFTLEKVMA